MRVVALVWCTLHILPFQMTSAAPSFVLQDDYEITVQKFLAVAEAVKAVEQAGGPLKILQDPVSRSLPPHILRLLEGLAFVQQDTNNSDLAPRINLNPFQWGLFKNPIDAVMSPIKGAVNLSVNVLLKVFNSMMGFSNKCPTPDPDFEGW